jgi:hypothetical protein
MRQIVILVLTLAMSGCVGFRQTDVEFVSKEQLAARDAETQCKALARTLVQMARCERR